MNEFMAGVSSTIWTLILFIILTGEVESGNGRVIYNSKRTKLLNKILLTGFCIGMILMTIGKVFNL